MSVVDYLLIVLILCMVDKGIYSYTHCRQHDISYTSYLSHIRVLMQHKSDGIGRYIYIRPNLARRVPTGAYRSMTTLNNALDDIEWDMKKYPKLDFNEDYYSVLETDPQSDKSTIKKAYYKMVFKYHPDNKSTDMEKSLANKQMMVINAAYKTLRDENLKAKYDMKRQTKKSGTVNVGGNDRIPFNDFKCRDSNVQSKSVSDWKGNDVNTESESGESLLDIFADMWKDLNDNKGARLLKDMTDFLENQLDINEEVIDLDRTVSDLKRDLSLVDQAITNMEAHLQDLNKSRDLQKVLQMSESKRSKTDVGNVESQFTREENIRGIEARIDTVMKQLRQLQRRRKGLDNSIQSNITSRKSRMNSEQSSSAYDPIKNRSRVSTETIDEQLQKLRREMGL